MHLTQHRILRGVATAGIAAVLILGSANTASATSVFASPQTHADVIAAPTSPETQLVEEGSELTPEERAQLDAVMSGLDDTEQVFDARAAESAGASAESIADFAQILSGGGWTIANGESLAEPSALAVDVSNEVRACTGYSGYKGFFGGFWQWGLNSCLTDSLIATVAGGGGSAVAIGGVLAAAGIAPGAAITAAAGALAGMSAGFLGICKTASYGVHAIYLNAYVTGNVGCWGQ